jgi:hypothetical protein
MQTNSSTPTPADIKQLARALDVGEYTVIADESAKAKALSLARGSFQRALVKGYHALSAMTVRSSSWRDRYVISGINFLERLGANGVKASVVKGRNNKNVLVIGA